MKKKKKEKEQEEVVSKRMAGNQKRGGEYDEFGGKRTRGYNDGRFEMRVLVPSRVSFDNSFNDNDVQRQWQ